MRNTTKLVLSLYYLLEQGTYTKKMITFESDIPCDVEVPVCLYEVPGGGLKIATEGVPQSPDPDFEPPTRFAARETLELVVGGGPIVDKPRLPENPTAQERWQYLIDVLKQ